MPPNEELNILRGEIRQDIRDLKASVDGLVTEKLCMAKHATADLKIEALGRTVETQHTAVLGAISSLRTEVGGLVNGKLEEHSREVVGKVIRDKAFHAEIAEVTGRYSIRKLRPSGENKPVLAKLGDSARNLTALIALIVISMGGCVTAAYYVVGLTNTLQKAVEDQQAILDRQKRLVQPPSYSTAPFPHRFDAGAK